MDDVKIRWEEQDQDDAKEYAPEKEPRFLRLPDVCRKLGVSRSTVYQWVMQRHFPAPLKIGRTSVWLESGVNQWMQHIERETRNME